MMTSHTSRALSVALLAASLVACSDDSARCIPGQTSPCTCPPRVEGTQVCLADGTYGACLCGSPDAGSDVADASDSTAVDVTDASDAPLDAAMDISADVAIDAPIDVFIDIASDVGADTTIDTPADIAIDTPADIAIDAPLDAAVDAPIDIALDTSADVAIDTPRDNASDTTLDAPADITADAASDVTADIATDVSAAITPARLLSPLTGSFVPTRQPLLRWILASGQDGARVEMCRDRAMTVGCVQFDATGAQARPPMALAQGVWFWRARARAGGAYAAMTSAVWRVRIPRNTVSDDGSWGWDTDFNGDGIADLLRWGDAVVHINLMSPTGALPAIRIDPPIESTQFVYPVYLGDYNGDGYGDFAVSDRGTAWIALGTATGAPRTPLLAVRGPTDPSFGMSIAPVGDITGDGLADVVLPVTGFIYILPGSASGVGTLRRQTPVNPSAGGWAVIGDVNGDGRSDLCHNAEVLLAQPDGTFDVSGRQVLANPIFAAPFDFDGDGYGDVQIVTDSSVPAAARVRGGPSGLTATPLAEPRLGMPADLDGDGDADLYAVDFRDRTILRFDGADTTGSPSTRVLTTVFRVGGYPRVTPGDVTGDGVDDAFFSQTAISNGLTYIDSASSFLRVDDAFRHAPAAPVSEIVNVGDVDNDRFADTALVEGDSAVLLRGSTSGFAAPVTFATLPAGTTQQRVTAVGDVNRDGFSDVVTTVDVRTFALWLGSARGLSTTPASYTVPITLDQCSGAATPLWVQGLGDVHGDGQPDLAVTTCANTAYFFRGRNGGFEATPVPYAPALGATVFPMHRPVPIRMGDVNRDGIGDWGVHWVVTTGYPSYLTAQYGSAAGVWTMPSTSIRWAGSRYLGHAIGDLDHDGFDDLYVDTIDSVASYVIPGSATGLDATRMAGFASAQVEAIGDYNGDGVDDLARRTGVGIELLPGRAGSLAPGVVGFTESAASCPWRCLGAAGDIEGGGGRELVVLTRDGMVTAFRVADRRVGIYPAPTVPLR